MELIKAKKAIVELTNKYNWNLEEKDILEKILIQFGREKLLRLTMEEISDFKRKYQS